MVKTSVDIAFQMAIQDLQADTWPAGWRPKALNPPTGPPFRPESRLGRALVRRQTSLESRVPVENAISTYFLTRIETALVSRLIIAAYFDAF